MRGREILALLGSAICLLPFANAAQQPATPAAAPSVCQKRLTPDIAVTHPLGSSSGPGICGGDDLVSLDAVVLKDGQRIALAPAATLRCPMAEAVARWVREGPPRLLLSAAPCATSSRAPLMNAATATASRA